MILVAGGSGMLGTQIVRLLSARGAGVRVLTRDPSSAAHLPAAAEIITGDLRNPATAAAAVRGCATVISAVHGFAGPGKPSPESIDRDANRALVRAATAAGADHFVLISVLGAAPDHPMSLHRAKHAAEQELTASGLHWTIIRPAQFCRWQDVAGIGDLTGTAAAIGLDMRRECSVAAGSRIAVNGVSLMAWNFLSRSPGRRHLSQSGSAVRPGCVRMR
jgi:uncharacterized protein YbjT (DUF2867 family)